MDDNRRLVREGYNRCAQAYAQDRDQFKNEPHLADLAARLALGAQVLDVGCGCGVPTDRYLLAHGCRVRGIDLAEAQIRLARELLPEGDFQVQDMTQLNGPDAALDAIVSFYAIFHIPREQHAPLMGRFCRLLRPGGWLLITMGATPWEGTEDDFHGVTMYWSHYGRAENLALVQAAGFAIVWETVDTSGGEQHLVILARRPA